MPSPKTCGDRESVCANRGNDRCHILARNKSPVWNGDPDWSSHTEYSVACVGLVGRSCAGGSGGGNLYRRSRGSAWISEAAGVDGRAVCAGPLCGGNGSADVQDR